MEVAGSSEMGMGGMMVGDEEGGGAWQGGGAAMGGKVGAIAWAGRNGWPTVKMGRVVAGGLLGWIIHGRSGGDMGGGRWQHGSSMSGISGEVVGRCLASMEERRRRWCSPFQPWQNRGRGGDGRWWWIGRWRGGGDMARSNGDGCSSQRRRQHLRWVGSDDVSLVESYTMVTMEKGEVAAAAVIMAVMMVGDERR